MPDIDNAVLLPNALDEDHEKTQEPEFICGYTFKEATCFCATCMATTAFTLALSYLCGVGCSTCIYYNSSYTYLGAHTADFFNPLYWLENFACCDAALMVSPVVCCGGIAGSSLGFFAGEKAVGKVFPQATDPAPDPLQEPSTIASPY